MRRFLDIVRLSARSLFRPNAAERELARELADHYERQVAENLAAGMTASEARRRARLSLGGIEQIKEECRDERGLHLVDDAIADLRYAVRTLRRAPGFTAVALLSLALGIGANTAIFSFLNTLLLKALPVPEPNRLVRVVRVRAEHGDEVTRFNYPSFREISRRARSFSSVLASWEQPVALTVGDTTERVRAELVSGSYFRTLGVGASIGRMLGDEDDGAEGGSPVCVISYTLWQARFNGDPGILSRPISIDHHPYQIVGVTAPGFEGTSLNSRTDLQIPMSMVAQLAGNGRDFAGWTWLAMRRWQRPH